MRYIASFFVLLIAFQAHSQVTANRAEFVFSTGWPGWNSPPEFIPLDNSGPFFSFFVKWEGEENPGIYLRFSTDGKRWDDWQLMRRDDHAPKIRISQLNFIDPEIRFFQVKTENNNPVHLKIHFHNPGFTVEKEPDSPVFGGSSHADCACPMPDYKNRDQWCPAGTCPPNPNPSYTQVTHLIVHHSAGANTASDWAAVVRAIWDFHVNGNGWADIGYNYLVDPNGIIYEGRGDNVLGAHFCGTNGQTMGVCMLGDFTSVTPQTAALQSLEKILSWKACDVGIDPLGTAFHPSSGLNLREISGHRDGCSTACPGDAFYPMLTGIREGVLQYLETVCAPVGLDDPDEFKKIRVYPNPAREIITLEAGDFEPGAIHAEILDARGKMIRAIDFAAGLQVVEIPLSAFPAGVYFLHWRAGRYAGNQKIIKLE